MKSGGLHMTTEDIYKNDKLDRKYFCEHLSRFIIKRGDKEDGLTITLNGGYGSGKTTFLRFLEKELSSGEKMTVVYYDCWKNSVIDEPLLSIVYALSEKLGVGKESFWEKAFKITKLLCKFGINKFIGEIPEADKDERALYDDMISYDKLIGDFKKDLGEIAEKKNIVILFDEMDRCLPAHAIQILEKIKHLFNIKGITCLIAVDNNQLEKTIETIFGQNTNVRGYLARFIDYDFDLPRSIKEENYILANKLEKQILVGSISSILDCFGFELREKIKLFDIFSLYDPDDSMDEWVMLAIVKCIRLKDEKLFNDIKKAAITPTNNLIGIEDTITKKLIDYLESKRFFQNVPNQSQGQIKMIFFSAFVETSRIRREQFESYFEPHINYCHQALGFTNKSNPFPEMLKKVLKFVNELS